MSHRENGFIWTDYCFWYRETIEILETLRGAAMSNEDLWPGQKLRVFVNEEEQFSIWPIDRDLPAGWRDSGKSGTREECLAYIEEVWTDMRPLSIRQAMERFRK